MAKYRVKYVYEQWYDVDIEAESEEQALEELQDSVQVEELEEASV